MATRKQILEAIDKGKIPNFGDKVIYRKRTGTMIETEAIISDIKGTPQGFKLLLTLQNQHDEQVWTYLSEIKKIKYNNICQPHGEK